MVTPTTIAGQAGAGVESAHMNRRLIALAVSLCLLIPVAHAQDAAKPSAPAPAAGRPSPLNERLDATLNIPALKNAMVGALVYSLKDGRLVYAQNPEVALMPASNQKILTCSAALALLDTNFKYSTTLHRTGMVAADGTLTGDLYLRGSGDPSLTSVDLKGLAEALKKAGVTAFQGRIVADASCFDDQLLGDGWQWDDEQFYYSAQVSGLNCDENVVLVEARPGAVLGASPTTLIYGGDKAASLPPTTYLTPVLLATTGSGNDPNGADRTTGVRIERLRAKNEFTVTGTIPLGGMPASAAVTIEDPARYAATRFREMLPAVGIRAENVTIALGKVPPGATVVATHESKPMSDLAAEFLKPSDNLYGECLLKTLGATKGKTGSWNEGARVLREFLRNAGVETSGLSIADGSGLSRMNNVTPRLIVELLTYIDQKFPAERRDAFEKALPVGGVDGTLRNRFKGTPAAGNLRAKTGSLSGVSSLSGYVNGPGGERFVFSLMMNHYAGSGTTSQARAAQDAFVLALIAPQ